MSAFNRQLEPLLGEIGQPPSCGVSALAVSPVHASACAAFIKTHWRDGKLVLTSHPTPLNVLGYTTYGKVLDVHDEEMQRLTTLLMTNALMPACRRHIPGFVEIELELTAWLHARFGTVVECYFCHALLQSPRTLRSTGFAIHQDTEEYDFIEYTVSEGVGG